jgi:aryl-alcohol dehydrogenase-like predicted oxidoreductase
MTWGEQNSESEAFAQIERAKAAGINFMDTAEMYPVPPKKETYASTETIIGNWFKKTGDRADWILASKIAGPGNGIDYIRDGQLKFNRDQIVAAVDRLPGPVPTALAGAQHQLLRQAGLHPQRRRIHTAA